VLCCAVLCLPPPTAGHSCEHELETARINGVLGNMDANTGAWRTVYGLVSLCVDAFAPLCLCVPLKFACNMLQMPGNALEIAVAAADLCLSRLG
jgi:hypothetical protein